MNQCQSFLNMNGQDGSSDENQMTITSGYIKTSSSIKSLDMNKEHEEMVEGLKKKTKSLITQQGKALDYI